MNECTNIHDDNGDDSVRLHLSDVQCCTFKKDFNYKFTKYIFQKYFSYFCQLLWTSGPKYKILLTKVIEIQNTFRSHCESISQSINEYSFSKQEKHKHISGLCFGTVPATV